MIMCNKGDIEIKGTAIQCLAELSSLVRSMYYNILIEECGATPEDAKKDILEAVEHGFKSEEEISGYVKDRLMEALNGLSDLLKDILSRKDDE